MTKKLMLFIAGALLLQSCALLTVPPAASDYGMSVNIGRQPAWGPTGYDYAAYYYMPDIDIYYDVNRSLFYYPSGRRWVAAQYLPPSYRSCDLYVLYKVVLNYDSPWQYNRSHRSMYHKYRNDRSQASRRSMMQNGKGDYRPWVDPDRTDNRHSTYKKRQLPPDGSQYRTPAGKGSRQESAGSSYRTGTQRRPAGGGYRTNRSDNHSVGGAKGTRGSNDSEVSSRSRRTQQSHSRSNGSSGGSSDRTAPRGSYSRGR